MAPQIHTDSIRVRLNLIELTILNHRIRTTHHNSLEMSKLNGQGTPAEWMMT